MEPVFLYQRWLAGALEHLRTSPRPPQLKGRPIHLIPRQYGTALLQAYLGQASLNWVAEVAGVPLAILQDWRQAPEFLLVMDWSKVLFAEDFRERLMLTDYSLGQLHEIAGEFPLLEDSLKMAVRIPLYQVFRQVGERLKSRDQHGLPLGRQKAPLFRRLFLFFLILEHFWPSPAQARIHREFLPLARDLVWPLLGVKEWVEPELAAVQKGYSLPQLRPQLAAKLKETFAGLP